MTLKSFFLSTVPLSAALYVALSAAANAQTFTPALSAVVGSGSEESFFTLDFQDGTAGHNYAFGYKYDGAKTGADFLTALSSGTPLQVGYYPGSGPSDPGGVYVTAFSFNGHSKGPTDDSYWAYFTGNDGLSWTYSSVGASDSPLANGSWDGWSWSAHYDPTPGAIPAAPVTPAAVPEASSAVSLGLLALLGAGIIAVRRKKTACA